MKHPDLHGRLAKWTSSFTIIHQKVSEHLGPHTLSHMNLPAKVDALQINKNIVGKDFNSLNFKSLEYLRLIELISENFTEINDTKQSCCENNRLGSFELRMS